MNRRTVARVRRRLRASTRNALELARLGRLADPYGAPYDIVDRGTHHRVRRYATGDATNGPPALLIPPLMLTAEVYDVAADVSAVTALGARGVQPFVVDFGAPERESGGMRRTLDDHVRAVVRSIEKVRALTGRDVHVCGYSQGGMFAYQAAAYLRSEGVRSLVTFGSPVDIHRNLPAVRSEITGALVRFLEPAVASAIDHIEGLPGFLTSTGFKLLSPRKEIEQRVEFLGLLHDRSALVRREARRKFLGGEGFVAWPGPALRAFVEEFIVHNRMLSGGFVIDGRTVTLADITTPILSFVGATDEIARPAAVRAIAEAAPEAAVEFVTIPAGHFGLVVGSRAMAMTWPTVAAWIRWREGLGPRPDAIDPHEPEDDLDPGDFDVEVELLFDTMVDTAKSAWRRVGDVLASASDAIDAVRFQEPRLRRLGQLSSDSRTSPSLALAEQAAASPDATFFLWRDRAFSYRDADTRVTNVARGLYACGVRPGDRVAVIMGSRPSFLSMVTGLGRLGAVAVIVPPDAQPAEVRRVLASTGVAQVVSDPDLAPGWHAALERPILVLGGGGGARTLPDGLRDMEAIDPAKVELPADFTLDPGRAHDLAMILLRPSESGELRAAPVTNHRWALSAFGAAAACTLKPIDTVYSCIPLHHPTGILVSVGSALIGGARLALAQRFSPKTFAADVRRSGATVVFYAGEMLRALLFQPPSRGDRTLPVRLFAGSGMRKDLAARLSERFGVGVLEFYAGTTHKVILANASGKKPGALGRVLPGSAPLAIVRTDLAERKPVRDERGFLVRSARGEPGLLVGMLSEEDEARDKEGVVEGAFAPGDRWFTSNDVVVEDEDGDVWFVDSLSGFVATRSGPVSTRRIEDALHAIPGVELACAFPVGDGREVALAAAVATREPLDPRRLAEAVAKLAPHERPTTVAELDAIPLTDGFRPRRRETAKLAASAKRSLRIDASGEGYAIEARGASDATASAVTS